MKKIISILLLLFPVLLYGQNHSWDGNGIRPQGKIHCLNIFINIIYDVHPECNNQFSNTNFWPPVTDPSLEGINTAAIPVYLLDWMDTVYVPGQLHGTCTRLFGESSFDSLQITGDFVVVNIRESTVLSQGTFNYTLINTIAINMLKQSGAITLFGHRNYDYFSVRNVLFRNITKTYGGLNPGSGYGGLNTIQCVGDGNFYANPTNIVIHEISHGLFGGNAFHTSGGNHRYPDGTVMPFLNLQCGYGLMGSAGSGLVSCNGYERWRMHWKHPQSVDYISARDITNTQSVVSDISKESGNRNFILRDFVKYGDVVRIRLPYKDSVSSSNQYIWLENHQIGNNNKLDFLQYSNTHSCRSQGTAGIYAYYQVGRDVLEGTYGQIWDYYHRDNLKIIPAEGYYDYEMLAETHNVSCVNYGEHNFAVRRGNANPLCGGQDQEFPLFPEATDNVLYTSREYETWRKYIDTVKDDHLPQLGDTLDAFRTHTTINMGTNPSTNNAKTYHSTNASPDTIISARTPNKNVQTTYLTGLSIEMTPIQGTSDFMVNIRWDDYNITNDVRWTGKIALKETAILTTGNNITLAQNRTVAQPTRDPETGLFAGRTHWRCENGSYFRQDSASVLHLTENSSLTFESGSRYELSKGATVRVGAGCTLNINPGAKVQFKGMVEIDSGGVLNVYDTVGMGNLSSLIVNPGGKLVVDGGTLTSACSGEMWQGIEVVGDRTKRQLPQYQGTVELRNGARIENAHCAIRTGLGDDNWHTTGGIVKADSAFFVNNRRSVAFLSYTNHNTGGAIVNNQSYFHRCVFTVNDNNLFGQNNGTFIDHVTMWEVRGVKFRGCTFNNLTTGNTGDRRHGIYTVDAGFTVDTYCSDAFYSGCECPENKATYSTFSGFTTAVEVDNSGEQQPVYINSAQFENNTTGVRIDANNYATITRNTFNLDNYPTTSGNIGLYLNTCTGYLVDDNTFERTTYPSGQFFIDNSIGIYVVSSGISSNSIHYNRFNNLTRGISVVGTNGQFMQSGLQMTCNDFYGGKYDIYLNNGATVSYLQGSPSKGADNVFVNSAINISNFYNSGALSITYYYNGSFPNLDPAHYSNLTKISINGEYNCSSTLCGNGGEPGGGGQYLAGFQSDMNAYTAASANQSPTDGTDGGVDPTWSETVRELSETYYNAVRGLLADTVLDLNDLEQWHTVAQPIADPYSLTETRFMMGYSEPFVNTDADDTELANYAEFHAMKLALRNAGVFDTPQQDGHINWYALTPAQIAQLQTIAERNAGRASVMAKGVLCFFFGICYDDDFLADLQNENTTQPGTRSHHSAQRAETQADDHALTVYPNPTDDILYVELSGAGIQFVGLYDLQGRVVGANNYSPLQGIAAINVRSVPAGVYVLRVTDENGHEYHRKIVVK